ncbi:MAG: WD40 repeat domain-containing protein, partial [Cyanobacteria bacterium P01_H01_bin.130]
MGVRLALRVFVDPFTVWVMALARGLGVATPWEPMVPKTGAGSPPTGTLGAVMGGSSRPLFSSSQSPFNSSSFNPSKLVAEAASLAVTRMRGSVGAIVPMAALMERLQQWDSLPLPEMEPPQGFDSLSMFGFNAPLAQVLLDQVIERLRRNGERQSLTVLIFDQFEEFFLTWTRPEDRRQCFEFLRDCLNLPYVKLIFSIREDYLHFLLDWERSLALEAVDNNVLDRQVRYGIGDFSPEDAIATVTGLMARSQFSLEPELIRVLVQDLAAESGRVNPIELQVVGAQLQTDGVTTLAAYSREYGSKNQVVERYLRTTIRDCGPRGEAIAWQVLFLLTAENGTRPLKNRSELEIEVGATGEVLDTVLQILEGAGLITVFRDRASWLYQLVHDYLTSYIRQQRQATEQARFRLTQSQLNRVLKRRVRELYGAGTVLTMLLISSLGLALNGAGGKTEAQIQAMAANADFLLGNSNQPFEALDRSLEAWQTLQGRRWSLLGNGTGLARSELQLATTLGQTLVQLREFNRLESHTDIVWSVAHSPTGEVFASSSTDGTVRLWQTNGKPVLMKDGDPWVWQQGSSANSVAFHPSGEVMAIAGGTGMSVVHLVDLQGEAIATLEGHTEAIFGVTYSGDGEWIATASAENTVRLWTAAGEFVREIRGHADAVEGVVFSPDSKTLATASDDKTVRLWSLAGQELRRFEGHTELVFSLDFSPDGQQLASASYDGTVKLWSLGAGASPAEPVTLTGHGDRVFAVKFSPDGQQLASASEDKTIRIWSRTGQPLQTLMGHTDRVTNLSFSPGGQWLVSASYDTTVRLWQLQGPIANRQGHGDRIYGMAISPDGENIVTGAVDGEIKLLYPSGTLNRILSPAGNPRTRRIHDVVFHPSGAFVAVVGQDSGVQLWNLEGDRFRTFGRRFLDGETIASTSVAFDPSGDQLAIAYDDGEIHLWTIQGTQFARLNLPPVESADGAPMGDRRINRVQFSPDGQHIAAGGSDHDLYLWDGQGNFLRRFVGHTNYISDVAFSPDGQLLASA